MCSLYIYIYISVCSCILRFVFVQLNIIFKPMSLTHKKGTLTGITISSESGPGRISIEGVLNTPQIFTTGELPLDVA